MTVDIYFTERDDMRQLKNFRKSGDPGMNPEQLAKEAMNKYGSLNEDELIEKLTESVARSKREGKFDPDELVRFASMMAPYLSENQREKMDTIIRLLDSD